MQRYYEVEPVPGVGVVEVISHSMLRDAWLAYNSPEHRRVNWSILPGATIYEVLARARGMAWANLQRGIPTTFVLHLMQNSVNRGLRMNEVLRLVKAFDALLKGPDFPSTSPSPSPQWRERRHLLCRRWAEFWCFGLMDPTSQTTMLKTGSKLCV